MSITPPGLTLYQKQKVDGMDQPGEIGSTILACVISSTNSEFPAGTVFGAGSLKIISDGGAIIPTSAATSFQGQTAPISPFTGQWKSKTRVRNRNLGGNWYYYATEFIRIS